MELHRGIKMKIGPSTIGLVLFTAVSVAAFAWMAQRPQGTGNAIGFAMPASTSGSSSATKVEDTGAQQAIDADSGANNRSTTEPEKKESEEKTSDSPDGGETKDSPATVDEKAATDSAESSTTATTADSEVKDAADESDDSKKSEETEGENNTSESQAADMPETSTPEENKEKKTIEPAAESTNSTKDNADKVAAVAGAAAAAVATTEKKTATDSKQDNSQSVEANTAAESATESQTSTTEDASTTGQGASENTEAKSAMESQDSTTAGSSSSEQDNSGSTETAVADQANESTPSPEQSKQELATSSTTEAQATSSTSSTTYMSAENARGTVVIMHGCDYKPESEDNIVRSLHENLPKEGWNTLSLALPNLSASSTYKDLEGIMPDAASRIESAIAMAKEKSQTPVVLLAHGCGAQIALAWMEVKGSDTIDGYIGLGAGIMNTSADDLKHLRLPLEKMKFPQLDIFGSADNEAVLKTAPKRLSYINRAANPSSRQKVIQGADHNMTGKEKELSEVVVKWLNGLAFKK